MAGSLEGKRRPAAGWAFNRGQKYALVLVAILLIWLGLVSLLPALPARLHLFVRLLPLWLLVTLGSASLANIGYHLVRLSDCPEAHSEIQAQIVCAKRDLAARGLHLAG